MGFKRPALPELIERVDNDLVSRLPGSQAVLAKRLTRVLATGEAGVAHGLYGYLQWMERQLFPETCDDELLHLHSVGVPRRQASAATGPLIFTGATGAVIDAGTLAQVDGLEYRTVQDVTLVAGTATVDVEALEVGRAGSQAAGVQMTLVSPVVGVIATATVGAGGITGGADIESFDSWRDRIMLRRARIPRGGAQGDWAEWAMEVPGVTRAWEDPLGMGPGTIVIRIMADDANGGPMPSQQLLDAVYAHIASKRNVTAHVYVLAPVPAPFTPRLRVTPNNSITRAAVEQRLQDLVLREGAPGGTLLISQIRNAIGTTGGVTDYELEWPTVNVAHAHGHLPIWGGVEWLA
ncbi:baseplate J/gp47 family protein [Stutzerimonas nitrititolerans]|uniref:baseplate J/gp47 family protein n=1 Tax=Stutzerimonas nitrititolerans TaxID=2482751 RepID=UPI0028ADFEF4|nr:baseplate J/gp47 family protein [Stutzerimonas nitrititolerans]